MRFVILGAGSGKPHQDYHLSSIMVQTNHSNLLVDCGDGVNKQILRHGYNGDFLDTVIISHYHPDHVSGIFMLIQMLYLEGRTKPLNLYLPERIPEFQAIFRMFYTFEGRITFPIVYHPVEEISENYPDINFALSDHLIGYKKFIEKHNLTNQMKSFSFSFTEDGKTLVYTSDITTLASIQGLLDNAHTVIVDALHPRAELVISLQTTKIKHVILTHGLSNDLRKWLSANDNPMFSIATESKTYQL